MATEIKLQSHGDSRGMLTVIEKEIPFQIKRVYYIYKSTGDSRGGHRHKKNIQALVCVAGSCVIDWSNRKTKGVTLLDSPDKILLLQPEDFHVMRDFTSDAVLLVLASEPFDPDDYIDEE
jgi:dTDP-4-dehydrorhamnose 3,5-epimerase-like enzyme